MDSKKEVARLQKKVSKWLKEWLANPMLIKAHSTTPEIGYHDHLNNQEEPLYLGPVHSSRFVFTFWNLDVGHESTDVER